MTYKLGILATHPIQYFSPWYRALAADPRIDLTVYYACRQTPKGQSAAGFGVPFEWDVPLLDGYRHVFLDNTASRPGTDHFLGCNTPGISNIIQQEHFDAFLVSGWHALSFWQAMRACWATGTPLMVRGDSQLLTARSSLKRLVKSWLYRRFIPRFDAYLIVGLRTRDYFAHYGAEPSRMYEVPHAVDNAFFAKASEQFRRERGKWREAWGMSDGQVVFLFVGKFLARKRPMDFLKAIERVRATSPRLMGLMAGDGPLRGELERYVRDHDLPVRFAGFLNQSELPKAYSASDVLVLPSDGSETWGLVVNEAMACGLPAIVSDEVGSGPDLVEPGVTGDLFSMGDVEALSGCLGEVSNHPERLARLSAGAKAKISAYSIERAVSGTIQAVEAISKAKRSHG